MWIQKEIQLQAHSRGFHLITNQVIESLPQISNIKIGLLHILLKHQLDSLRILDTKANYPTSKLKRCKKCPNSKEPN